MNRTLRYILLVCWLAALCGCGEKCVPGGTINTDMFHSFDFKVGTYWIYKDSIDGRLDSFYVTQGELTKGATCSLSLNDGYYCAIKEMNIDGQHVADSMFWGINLDNNQLTLHSFYFGSYYYYFKYPFKKGSETFPDSIIAQQIYPNYDLMGNTYDNVVAANFYQRPVKNDWIYICERTGIVKMSFYTKADSVNNSMPYRHVWELVRSRVIL